MAMSPAHLAQAIDDILASKRSEVEVSASAPLPSGPGVVPSTATVQQPQQEEVVMEPTRWVHARRLSHAYIAHAHGPCLGVEGRAAQGASAWTRKSSSRGSGRESGSRRASSGALIRRPTTFDRPRRCGSRKIDVTMSKPFDSRKDRLA